MIVLMFRFMIFFLIFCACFSLTMLPLLMLMDVAVKCRSEKKVNLGDSVGGLLVSDFVAEKILLCVEEILKKCHLGSVDQVREYHLIAFGYIL